MAGLPLKVRKGELDPFENIMPATWVYEEEVRGQASSAGTNRLLECHSEKKKIASGQASRASEEKKFAFNYKYIWIHI